jgi:acetyl-CoA synthetase
MPWETIVKSPGDWRVVPNLQDYAQARGSFSWSVARRELEGLPDGHGLNIAHEAVARHANGPLRDHLAIRWLGKKGEIQDYTYADLQALSNRFANVLKSLGIGKGDRVYLLAGRIPELYTTALGTLKNRSVLCPLFSAFGPEPIKSRVMIGEARLLVTTQALYERKVKRSRPGCDGSCEGVRHSE